MPALHLQIKGQADCPEPHYTVKLGPTLTDATLVPQKTIILSRKVYPLGSANHPGRPPSASTPKQRSRPQRCSTKRLKRVLLQFAVTTMALTCMVWTLSLLVLALKPNETVNWLMKTESFDNGSFWLMVDASTAMTWASVCGISVVAVAYATVIVKVLRRNNRVGQESRSSLRRHVGAISATVRNKCVRSASGRFESKLITLLDQWASLLQQDDGHATKIIRVWIKIADLVVESGILYQILEAGSPFVLVAAFSTIVGMNALSCAMMMFLPDGQSGLAEVFVDIFFDFLIVVVYPVLMVVYCLSTFSLDRQKIAVNLDVFPDGWFERNARVIANPVQTDVIYKALKSLQMFSLVDWSLRVGVHLVFSYRLYRVAELVQEPHLAPSRIYPKRNFASATFLIVFAVAVVVFVEKSVWTSASACQPHPECAVKAHRWTVVEEGSLTQCPCLTLIDEDLAPETFDEWMKPKDATLKVIQLAATGDLRTIKLTNRYLPIIPDDLRACRHVRHVSLVYTYTEQVPDWIKEFIELEYLYVEGSLTNSLRELPNGMFDGMASLSFIHLGMHVHMAKLPSFKSLSSLKTLTLALLTSLTELPSFDSLHNLERLIFVYLPRIETLPDLKSLQNLKSFSVNDRGSWCCNGFLHECDLQNSFCAAHPFWGIPSATCLPSTPAHKATNATLAVIQKFSTTVCAKKSEPNSLGPGFPTQETIAQCGGILYRKCELPGHKEAMCYNARFMAIFCSPGPLAIEMRRRQIRLGIGDKCNPEYEAWLGCT